MGTYLNSVTLRQVVIVPVFEEARPVAADECFREPMEDVESVDTAKSRHSVCFSQRIYHEMMQAKN